jgi:hypothetical protein
MEREERDLYFNEWELVHPFPIVDYEPTNIRTSSYPIADHADGFASVKYGGVTRQLAAHYKREMKWESLSIQKFAAKFPKGRRIWNARMIFWRKPRFSEWTFMEVYTHEAPLSLNPPLIIGFLADFPAKDRGVSGLGKFEILRYRALAGLPDGPKTAADIESWSRRPNPL